MSPWSKTNASVSADSGCPGEDQLRDLLAGGKEPSAKASLVAHLDGCRSCRARLESLAASDELWSRTIRNLREITPDEFDEPRGLMARLQTRIVGADETLAPYTREAKPDLLQPCSTPGRLGCVGAYEVVEVLGRGGMGVVYKAVDPALDRTVAIKVLACPPGFSAEARARFRREARAAAAVRSDHAVVIHAVEEAAEPPYLVMEYVAGTSLQERLDRSGPLEIDEILRIGAQIARGLAAAHAQGLIHRDVKPANVLLEAGTGTVKITDFGLARAIDAPSLTQSGTVTGTPEYMAPEQAGDRAIDHRADLFSLGSVLYAMCTGRPPFRAERSLAVLRRIREETPVPIRQLRPEVPEPLVSIIEKLHRKAPDDRHANAVEVADALEQLQGTGAVAPRFRFRKGADPVTPLARTSGRGARGEGASRRRLRWALLAALLVLAGAFAASELAGWTGIASWAVSRTQQGVSQDEPEPAAPASRVNKPTPATTPATALAPADDSRPKQIYALRLFEGHTGTVCGLTLSPDGKRVVSCSGRPFGDGTMRLWDIARGKEIRRLHADTLPVLPRDTKLLDPPGDIQRVAFAPDGRHVLFGGANGLLGLWDVDTGNVVRRFVGHTIYVDGVAVSRDGKQALSAGTEGTVRLWDMATGRELQRMAGHTDGLSSVAFSPDGTRALSGSRDHTMRLWDLRKGEQIRAPFLGHSDCVLWTVVFMPDGQQALSIDSTVRLWDLNGDPPDRRQLRTFDAHTAPVLDVAVSSDGRRILSGSVDGTARLWDRFTGREIATLVGHRNWIQAVALTPDGRFALTSGGAEGRVPPYRPGNDFAIRLWELPREP